MKEPKVYSSPGAFRSAFRRKVPARLQKIRIMQRFALRVCSQVPSSVVKGGLALELRFNETRTTKDIDFVLSGAPDETLGHLRRAAAIDLGDFLRFEVSPETRGAIINRVGMAYAGARYIVRAFFGGRKEPEAKFVVDVTYGAVHAWDEVAAVLPQFPTTKSGTIRLYPTAKQIAEKTHAYTDPLIRDDPKQLRVRDLVDICIFATRDEHDARALRQELQQTFDQRRDHARTVHDAQAHSLPSELPPPPATWGSPYLELARRDELVWSDIMAVYAIAKTFLDPVLADPNVSGRWKQSNQAWLDAAPPPEM